MRGQDKKTLLEVRANLAETLSNTRYGRTVFAHGRSKNATTDKQYLIRRKQRVNPDRYLTVCRGSFHSVQKIGIGLAC